MRNETEDRLRHRNPYTAEVADVAQGNWLEWAFENLTNPLAVIVFAAGVGGLAVVNLALSHYLLTDIARGITDIYQRHTRLTEVLEDYHVLQRAQRRYRELAHKRRAIARMDEETLASELATEAYAVIQEALAPSRVLQKDLEYAPDPSRLVVPEHLPPDPKQLARDISKIDAIGIDQILEALGAKEPTRRSKK